MLENFFMSLQGLSPLVVDRIEKDHVLTPSGFNTLYGFQLASNVERVKTAGVDTIKKLIALQSPLRNKTIYLVIKRDRLEDTFLDSVYYLSFNREVLQVLSEAFGSSNVRWLKGYELANVLLSLILLTPITTVKDFERKDVGMVFRESVPVREKFYRLVKEVDPWTYQVLLGGGHTGTVSNFERLFLLDWSGVIYVSLDFNDPSNILKRKAASSLKHFKTLKEMEKAVRDGTTQYVGVSACMVSKENIKEVGTDILYGLGFNAIPLQNSLYLYALSTPLLVKDPDFEFFLLPEVVKDYLIYSYAKSSFPQQAELAGKNRYGAFVSYSFFEENDNPHCMIFAPSGAGKSFAMQNMIANILRLDVSKVFNGETFGIKPGVRVRYFDKGFSAEIFFRLLKERKVDVGIFSARPDDLTLNPCEVFSDEGEEYDFSLYVVNACLEAAGTTPLIDMEAIFYRNALREVVRNVSYRGMLSKQISYISQAPALGETYRKLKELGYSDMDYIHEIREPEFNHIKQPLLADVIRVLQTQSGSVSLTTREKEAVKSAIGKLSVLSGEPNLKYPTQIDLRSHRLIYLDFEHLSRSKYFVPIVLTIFKKLTHMDKFEKPPEERAYYVVDEAHNMLRNEYFRLALEVLIREARKYRINVTFLTQNFEEVPPTFIQNANTLMLISPQEEESRRMYLTSFYRHMGMEVTGKSDLEHIYYETPARTFVVRYSRGVFSLMLDVDQVKRDVFDSYRREIVTPDGKLIVKSMKLAE